MESVLEFISAVDWYWYGIVFISMVAIADIFNKEDTILRNFPVVGHTIVLKLG